jgi:type IV pilus assembly protein PilA
MKSQKQSGFTLIELMIVVTIIGILASIAVPAYRDYTIRTRVGECASIFSIIKTESSIYYSENGTLPADLIALNSLGRVTANPAQYNGDYVSAMDIVNGNVTCFLQTRPELGNEPPNGASGGTVLFTASVIGNTINWDISGGADLPVPNKFLPAQI